MHQGSMKLPLLAVLIVVQLPCSSRAAPHVLKLSLKWTNRKKEAPTIHQQQGRLNNSLEKDLSAVTASWQSLIILNEHIVNRVFERADSNHDGSIDFREVYELVLKIFITINQQAPIPPPTKQVVLQLFLNADTTHSNRLNREEFKGLANILAKRAISRVIAHKLVTLMGAPLIAAYLMRIFTGTELLPRLAKALVPDRYEEKVLPIITSKAFCRTALIIILVSTLGNMVTKIVNWILDFSSKDEENDVRLKAYKNAL